jgi:hypothetical protein
MRAAERVTWVDEIDVQAQPLAFSGRKDCLDIEKRKSKRLEANELQSIEVKPTRPPMP